MSMAEIYGKSLYTLAYEEKMTELIYTDLKSVLSLFKENPDYVKILDSPQIGKSKLLGIIDEDFKDAVNTYTLNFLKVLCENRMVRYFDECFDVYEKQYNSDNNIKIVSITTAKELTPSLEEKLLEKLKVKMGGEIVLEKHVDETQIGGIIIESDGIRIDSSLKSELNNLKRALTE